MRGPITRIVVSQASPFTRIGEIGYFEMATFGGAYEFGEDVRSEDEYSVSSVDEEELASLVRMDLDVDKGEIFKKYRILASKGSERAS